MKKGQQVVKILNIVGHECAVIETIEKVTKNYLLVEGSQLKYDPKTLHEIDPVIPGCSTRLIRMDGDES